MFMLNKISESESESVLGHFPKTLLYHCFSLQNDYQSVNMPLY